MHKVHDSVYHRIKQYVYVCILQHHSRGLELFPSRVCLTTLFVFVFHIFHCCRDVLATYSQLSVVRRRAYIDHRVAVEGLGFLPRG